MTLTIPTTQERQVVDITKKVAEQLSADTKVCVITALHTTCAVTTADLDPGTDEDLLEFLEKVTPQGQWRHPHNPAHAPSHLLSSIIGASVSLPVENGRLCLGTWQRVVLIELDGPRERSLSVSLI